MMTKYTLRISVPIAFHKFIFGEDYSSIKIPCKNYSLQWDLYFLNLLIIIY
jgi:hypothetical protein